jgi:hypothetical protein
LSQLPFQTRTAQWLRRAEGNEGALQVPAPSQTGRNPREQPPRRGSSRNSDPQPSANREVKPIVPEITLGLGEKKKIKFIPRVSVPEQMEIQARKKVDRLSIRVIDEQNTIARNKKRMPRSSSIALNRGSHFQERGSDFAISLGLKGDRCDKSHYEKWGQL